MRTFAGYKMPYNKYLQKSVKAKAFIFFTQKNCKKIAMNAKKTSIYGIIALFMLSVGILTTPSCTETTTTTDSCDLTISSLSLKSTSLTRGGSLGDGDGSNSANDAGSIVFSNDVGLDNTRLRDLAQQMYLSTDNQFSSGDIQLTAFTNTPSGSSSVTVKYDQIDIPSNAPTGAAFVLVRISGEPCPTGGSIPSITKAVAVTVN